MVSGSLVMKPTLLRSDLDRLHEAEQFLNGWLRAVACRTARTQRLTSCARPSNRTPVRRSLTSFRRRGLRYFPVRAFPIKSSAIGRFGTQSAAAERIQVKMKPTAKQCGLIQIGLAVEQRTYIWIDR